MRDISNAVFLADYQPPPFLVDQVRLRFRLDPQATHVTALIRFRPNPAAPAGQDLRLDGESLRLIRASIDGTPCPVQPDGTGLNLPAAMLPPGPFDWEAEVEITPAANTALEGLYISNGMFCTQCEAEGFRKITFYPDRPDVMAPFHVRIESDLPVLLSNGNPVAQGPGWAEWDDPHPKPSYLFALVAGDLLATRDRFTTADGRAVALTIWTRAGDEDKTAYAMGALKRAMVWDEQAYGRVYDLDVFNIVAVDDFNMGAMENKGLNIFNSRCVLASAETATDADFASIERIIAHEYFHNWTGNRITCRDWFQLSLKEGLTVFRDQQFMADMRSPATQRIAEVLTLRARQFREDAGPLAHAVRPESYAEINNFYTATIYEKGAELIRMLQLLVGEDRYRASLDLYFSRHDGQACTIEDWIAVFEEAAGRDLSQFRRWYEQAGTPHVDLTEDWTEDGTYTLTLRQHTPTTPGQPLKEPLLIPVAFGLLAPDGTEIAPTRVLELDGPRLTLKLQGLPVRPVASVLRGFSAPVILRHDQSLEDRALRLAHDTDPFARFEAGRSLAQDTLLAMITGPAAPGPAFVEGLRAMLRDDALDPAFRALVLRLPDEEDLATAVHAAGHVPDPDAIHAARRKAQAFLAQALAPDLAHVIQQMQTPGPFSPGARDAGRRALRLQALSLLGHATGPAEAQALFRAADNMTDQLGAWAALLAIGAGEAETSAFHRRWSHERLVIDKWFAMQVSHAAPERAVALARALTDHADFNWKNPNRFRSVIGALGANPAGFHDPSGAGYDLAADWLIRLDRVNPQAAARSATMFETWRRHDVRRQHRMRAALERIAAHPALSRDMNEMTTRLLEPAAKTP